MSNDNFACLYLTAQNILEQLMRHTHEFNCTPKGHSLKIVKPHHRDSLDVVFLVTILTLYHGQMRYSEIL